MNVLHVPIKHPLEAQKQPIPRNKHKTMIKDTEKYQNLRKIPKEAHPRIQEMHKQGMSLRQIAHSFRPDVSRQRIKQILDNIPREVV